MSETYQTESAIPYVGRDRRTKPRPLGESALNLLIGRLDDMRDDQRETAREVKGSLEKLADAVTALALVEQQLSTNTQAQSHLTSKVDVIEGRVDVLEQAAPANKRIADWVTAAVWAAAGGGVALTLKVIVMGNLAAVLKAMQ
jgi:hypothetical protein